MIIYKTTNLVNGKIYVGKHHKDNDSYLGSGKLIKRAIKKYGKGQFKRTILEHVNESNWADKEIYWISELNSTDINIGYNILPGGEGGSVAGWKYSKESLKRLSIARSGEKNAMFGKTHNDHTKSLISNKCKERYKTKEDHPMYNRKHSEESKIKMSISSKGNSAWNKGVKGQLPWNKKLTYNGVQYTAKDLAIMLNVRINELKEYI